MVRKVAVLVGSLRKASFNKKLALQLEEIARGKLAFDFIEIGDLAIYNEDVEAAGAPAAWTAFRDRVKAADAILVVTPEYNRSIPGALKNAIDVGSRPWGKSVWAGKPLGIVSSSMGPLGGFNANQHVRQSLGVLGTHAMTQPEMYLGTIHTWFDEAGQVKDEAPKKLMGQFVDAFTAWIEKFV